MPLGPRCPLAGQGPCRHEGRTRQGSLDAREFTWENGTAAPSHPPPPLPPRHAPAISPHVPGSGRCPSQANDPASPDRTPEQLLLVALGTQDRARTSPVVGKFRARG